MSRAPVRPRPGPPPRLRPALLAGAALGLVLSACLSMLNPASVEWDPPSAPAQPRTVAGRAPCAERQPLRRAWFGDLHVHTGASMDARSRDMIATADDAYRFARGEPIGLGPFDAHGRGARPVQISRPLDFAAVTDHAEWLAEVALCTRPGSPAWQADGCRQFRGERRSGGLLQAALPAGLRGRMLGVVGVFGREREICGPGDARCREWLVKVWRENQAAAERWYDRSSACRFTTFHAWEYSASPERSKVHRNVILRNEIVPELPISWLDEPEPLGLWEKLEQRCNRTGSGCQAIAIPHNPNLSNGRLLAPPPRDVPLAEQRRQAALRAALEPLVEMTQVKGDSECANGLSGVVGGPDELCGYEKLREVFSVPEDCGDGTGAGALAGRGCRSRRDFVRSALIEGLREQQRLGVNPFAFGLIGSTDTHNATPGDVEEYDFEGCCANKDATPQARLSMEGGIFGALRNPGGLVGVWAEENTRDALFDALLRRETFATSGPRIQPRLFAGWELPADLCETPEFTARGYRHGVPMGALLPPPPAGGGPGAAPRFAVQALRDAGVPGHPGGLLQRVQIVKGWVGDDGLLHQAVHDVAGRADNGAGVDLASCRPHGPGADALCAVWSDPDFDAARGAVYYARIVENPSCRWSWHTCLRLPEAERPAACRDARIPKTIQERAWTSPVWYVPAAS